MIPVRVGLLVRFLPCVFNATNFSHQFAEQRVPILCAFKIRRKKWNPPQKKFMNNMFLKIRTSGFPRPTKKKKNNGQHNFCWKNKKNSEIWLGVGLLPDFPMVLVRAKILRPDHFPTPGTSNTPPPASPSSSVFEAPFGTLRSIRCRVAFPLAVGRKGVGCW